MAMRVSRLAASNLVLAVAMVAVGLPGIITAVRRVPAEIVIETMRSGQHVSQPDMDAALATLETVAPLSPAARRDMALGLLARDSAASSLNDTVRADHAARELRTYLSSVPDDWRAWADLAIAEVRRSNAFAAVEPFKMSIELAPAPAEDLGWRCGLGFTLLPLLDDEGREMLIRQVEMAMSDTIRRDTQADFVRYVEGKGLSNLVRGALEQDPVARQKFEHLIVALR